MTPAYSVIVFTTLSGAGYGLIATWAVLSLTGGIPASPVLALTGPGLALVMISCGLLTSTLHLGRPERAWRALSQWRSSWLSREGVLALVTYCPALAFALSGVFGAADDMAAALTALGALATVASTGMIYQSLPTVRAWHQPIVTPVYVTLALASGGLIALALLALVGIAQWPLMLWVIAMLCLGAWLKSTYWLALDSMPPAYTAGQATGLGAFGQIRVLDPPHTQPNFVMREMGYVVARKHARKLRRIVLGVGLIGPAILVIATSLLPPSAVQAVLLVAATAACAVGIFTERWLFFAEAQHVVSLYYGAQTA